MRLPFKISLNRTALDIEWGGPNRDFWFWSFYFWEEDKTWVYQDVTYRNRRWGIEHDWYDGPFTQVKLWFSTITWQTQWTKDRTEWTTPEVSE